MPQDPRCMSVTTSCMHASWNTTALHPLRTLFEPASRFSTQTACTTMANATCPCLAQPLADAVMPEGFCAFTLPVSIDQARSVLSLPGGNDVLALERGTESVVVLEDTDDDGVPDSKRVVAQADNLNHGIALYDGFLYASSDTTVYRWPWDSETNSVTGSSTIVINNINADGNGGAPQGHTTRTLEFDSFGRLYVSVGSNENVDPDSYRSRIRRFDIASSSPDESAVPSSAPSDSVQPSATPVPSSTTTVSLEPSGAPTESFQPSTSAAPSLNPTGSSQPSGRPIFVGKTISLFLSFTRTIRQCRTNQCTDSSSISD